ncbi:carbohydrate ABC transporter permease [Marispirochaeta aestuarii]|uniref:carbohydrate ABC transporter permease n=1 Tax=Marispirochaeta aestuarii TaxID=1963862 RepID=UPI0029C84092|nr:carbohydrate ABC transporter permease [Marispirochaeta aestuarii]
MNKILIFALLILLAVLFLLPVLWNVLSAFKPATEILTYPPTLWPRNFSLEQFQKLFTAGNGIFFRFIRNTVYMTFFTIILVLIVSTLSAYGLSVLPFRGSKLIFILILAIMMVPFQSLLIPLYNLMNRLHLLDTIAGMVLVYSTFFMPLCIFLLKNYFSSLPASIRESARLDGAGELTILWRIYLPLSLPALATCLVYLFLETWNDFVLSLIYSSSNNVKNIQVGIMNFGKQRFQSDWGIINAGTAFSIVPTVLIFLLLQRYYVQGMTSGSNKE